MIEIITARFYLTYDKKPFSASGLSVVVKGAFGQHASVWRYGEVSGNLGGPARTPMKQTVVFHSALESSLVRAMLPLDDSGSTLFAEDGV